jgi:peptidoglycan lytic transglycosylase
MPSVEVSTGGANVSFINETSCAHGNAARVLLDRSSLRKKALPLFGMAAMAAMLAACAQPSVVAERSVSGSRHASSESYGSADRSKKTSLATRAHGSVDTKHAGLRADDKQAEKQPGSYGLASYYRPSHPANGEKPEPGELTAAHRSLPFGTRVRVTNVATGQSVTVRVNDRGPFIPGRVVDVSHSAAQSLGIVGQGVAKVKLDVVE